MHTIWILSPLKVCLTLKQTVEILIIHNRNKKYNKKWINQNTLSFQSLFNKLVELTEEARKAYKDMVAAMEQEQAEEALKNVKKVPHHMGHSRNPSAASAISFCSVISEPISEVNEKEYGKLLNTILNNLNYEMISILPFVSIFILD